MEDSFIAGVIIVVLIVRLIVETMRVVHCYLTARKGREDGE